MPLTLNATPRQIEFITCPARFLGLFAGRRFGKTFAVRVRLMFRAITKNNQEITYISPLSFQAREVYRAIIKDKTLTHRIAHKTERPYPEIVLDTGSRIKFRSMQRPEGIRSTGEDEVILDEIQDPIYTEEDINAIVLPLLGDRRGTLVVAGQFRGQNWYYKRFFLPGQSPFLLNAEGRSTGVENKLYKSWQIDSKEGHCFQGPEGQAEYELQISLVPKAIADQEWRCIPTANIRAVFDHDWLLAANNAEQLHHKSPQPGWKYIIGLDLGGRFDHSALCLIAWDGNKKHAYVLEAYTFPLRTPHADQAMRIGQIARQWNAVVVADNTGGAMGGYGQVDAVFRFYRENIRDLREFSFNVKTKGLLVRNMSLQLEQGRLSLPASVPALQGQLADYEWKYEHGLYRYSAPVGKHDDLVIALGLAIEGGLRGWAGTPAAAQGAAALW